MLILLLAAFALLMLWSFPFPIFVEVKRLDEATMSSSKPEVDLSAFPIIRLDHIPHLDDNTLTKAKNELLELIETSDGSNAKWVGYLQKQYDAMNREELNRQAESRIQQLLSGKVHALETDYNAILSQSAAVVDKKPPRQPRAHQPVDIEGNESSVRDSNSWMQQNMVTTPPATMKPSIPITGGGGSKRHRSPAPSPSLTTSTSSKDSLMAPNIGSSSATVDQTASSKRTPSSSSKPQVAMLDLTASNLEQATRENSRQQSREGGDLDKKEPNNTSESKNEHMATTRSGGSLSTTRSGKSKKSNPEDDAPSKKCMEVVYKNFGSVFVVAATEKKKRYYAPKKPTETPEEAKKREKLER